MAARLIVRGVRDANPGHGQARNQESQALRSNSALPDRQLPRTRVALPFVDIRIGAYGVIVNAARRVLLTHWNEDGGSGWVLPGGGLEDYETCEQAAVREIREETGYDVQLLALLGVDSLWVPTQDRPGRTGGPLHALRVIFHAHVVGGEISPEVGGSTDEARWVPLEAVSDLPTRPLVPTGLALWQRNCDNNAR